jgi:protein-S-isoprenylcysteine O-methyltransferase Ste14
LDQPLLSRTPSVSWAGVAFVGAGIVLAIWARTILGRNWSGVAVVKAGHDHITGGPYQIVRHPIYTGILMAVLGTAVVRGTLHAMLAFPICLLSYWLKLQTEEDMLIRQFGHNYLQYRRRVKALIPYLL